jgi:hypothetical protein
MVAGSSVTEVRSEVLGSESGPKSKAPFGHPRWVPRRLGILARCACSSHVEEDYDDADADADDYDNDDDDDGDGDGDGDDCLSTRDAGVNVGAWIDVHARAIREILVDRDWEDAFAKLGRWRQF